MAVRTAKKPVQGSAPKSPITLAFATEMLEQLKRQGYAVRAVGGAPTDGRAMLERVREALHKTCTACL